jgi:hypothetical protein
MTLLAILREKSSRSDEFTSMRRAMRKTVRFVSFPYIGEVQ